MSQSIPTVFDTIPLRYPHCNSVEEVHEENRRDTFKSFDQDSERQKGNVSSFRGMVFAFKNS